jgi:hypothetical protein
VNTFWHWVELIGAVLGTITALVTLPPIMLGYYRWVVNWRSLRSRRTAVKRLAELEQELQKLSEQPTLDEPQANFYNLVIVMLSGISSGLLAAAWYAYNYLYQVNQPQKPSIFLALACVMFFLIAVLGFAFAKYFSMFIKRNRIQRTQEIERAIATIRARLG